MRTPPLTSVKNLPAGKGAQSAVHEQAHAAAPEELSLQDPIWSRGWVDDRSLTSGQLPGGGSPKSKQQCEPGSPLRARQQYGAWYMPPHDWKAVYGGSAEDEETLRHKLGLVTLAEMQRRHELMEKHSTLQQELGMSYTVKVYREYMRSNNLPESQVTSQVPAVIQRMVRMGMAQHKPGPDASPAKPLAPVNAASSRGAGAAGATSAPSSSSSAAARALGVVESVGLNDLEPNDGSSPGMMPEALRRAVVVNDKLQQHRDKLARMEQQRQAQELEWSRCIPSPKKRLNSHPALSPPSPKAPAGTATPSLLLPAATGSSRPSQPSSPTMQVQYPFHSSAASPEPGSPGASPTSSRAFVFGAAADQGEGSGAWKPGADSPSRSSLGSSIPRLQPGPASASKEPSSESKPENPRIIVAERGRGEKQQQQQQQQQQQASINSQQRQDAGAGLPRAQAPSPVQQASGWPQAPEPDRCRLVLDLQLCGPDWHEPAGQDDVPLAVRYLAEMGGPAPPGKSPSAWKPPALSLQQPRLQPEASCSWEPAGAGQAGAAGRRWRNSSVPLLRSALQAAADARLHCTQGGGSQRATPLPASSPLPPAAGAGTGSLASLLPACTVTPSPLKLPPHAACHRSPHPDAMACAQTAISPPAFASSLEDSVLAQDDAALWRQPSPGHQDDLRPQGSGICREGHGADEYDAQGCNFSLAWLSQDKAHRPSIFPAARQDQKAKGLNSPSLCGPCTTPHHPRVTPGPRLIPARAQSSLDFFLPTYTTATPPPIRKPRNRRLSN